MMADLQLLLDRYDSGELSRRELLSAFALTLLPASASAAPDPAVGLARTVNHVTLFVRNVEQSRRFYQDLFGLSRFTRQDPGLNLFTGAGFVGLYPADAQGPSRIDHFCLGLARFDAEASRRKLAERSIEATIRQRGDTSELYFTDPDGIRVQLQDVRYRGGVGPVGDRDP